VVGAVFGVVALWGGLHLAFDGWRAGIQDRIDFGKATVAPAIRPLSEIEPPGIPERDWQDAVSRSEAMLGEVVGTGRLDRMALERLRTDLGGRVAEARRSPPDAPAILGRVWDDMARLKRLRAETERPVVLPGPDQSAEIGGPAR
jgi:hypothetical protein